MISYSLKEHKISKRRVTQIQKEHYTDTEAALVAQSLSESYPLSFSCALV